MLNLSPLAIFLFASAFSSCFLLSPASGTTGSCKYPQTFKCQEYRGQSSITLTTVQSTCTSLHGEYRPEECDRTSTLGGCSLNENSIMNGASIVTWYFPGAVDGMMAINTSADVMTTCTGPKLTYLSPES